MGLAVKPHNGEPHVQTFIAEPIEPLRSFTLANRQKKDRLVGKVKHAA